MAASWDQISNQNGKVRRVNDLTMPFLLPIRKRKREREFRLKMRGATKVSEFYSPAFLKGLSSPTKVERVHMRLPSSGN